jgi:hypothetical protein
MSSPDLQHALSFQIKSGRRAKRLFDRPHYCPSDVVEFSDSEVASYVHVLEAP